MGGARRRVGLALGRCLELLVIQCALLEVCEDLIGMSASQKLFSSSTLQSA
jgi:hypothetical protein